MTQILIVEDEAIVAMDLERTLVRLGYGVCGTVATAEDALARAAAEDPDLVLMDIHIRGTIDGIDTARLLRKGLNAPIIFLTAYADDVTITRASQAEADGYLVKPYHDRELRSTIEVALYRQSLQAKRLATLAGAIAHEINNPLACVMSSLRFIESGTPIPAGDVAQALDDAHAGAERIKRAVVSLGVDGLLELIGRETQK